MYDILDINRNVAAPLQLPSVTEIRQDLDVIECSEIGKVHRDLSDSHRFKLHTSASRRSSSIGITSTHNHLFRHRHVFHHSVVNERDADRPVILVE